MRIRIVALLLACLLVGLGALSYLTGRQPMQLAQVVWQSATSAVRAVPASPEKSQGSGGATPSAAPVAVTVSRPLKRSIVEWDEYTGRFDAVESVEIRARVSGYLTDVRFKDGQDVAAGELLFVIDPRPFERALAQAEAEFEQAKVKVSNAFLDVERGKPLAARNVISQKTQDDRENLWRDAEAALKVSEAKVKPAELDLSFTRVTAPVAGRLGRTLVTKGNYVSAGGSQGSTLLTTIVSQSPIYVYFDVNENNAIKYKRLSAANGSVGLIGAVVGVALPDEKEYPHQGRLDFLDNRIDAATGTWRARAILDNAGGLFSAGMFARVRMQGSPEYEALLLPDEAVGTDQTSRYVLIAADDGATRRSPVRLGPLYRGLRVVREGVGPDDWVVVKGQARLRPGLKVAPKQEQIELSEATLAPAGGGTHLRLEKP